MPIFEYICRNCQHQFELIVHASNVPQCPSCQSKKLEKQLSVFAAGGANNRQGRIPEALPAGACGTCGDPRGPGSCSLS